MSEAPVSFVRPTWKDSGSSRIPFWTYTDEETYRRELDRFFYSNHWCYAGLEAEIPNPGDFKRTVVGERSVIVTRTQDGDIAVVQTADEQRGLFFVVDVKHLVEVGHVLDELHFDDEPFEAPDRSFFID